MTCHKAKIGCRWPPVLPYNPCLHCCFKKVPCIPVPNGLHSLHPSPSLTVSSNAPAVSPAMDVNSPVASPPISLLPLPTLSLTPEVMAHFGEVSQLGHVSYWHNEVVLAEVQFEAVHAQHVLAVHQYVLELGGVVMDADCSHLALCSRVGDKGKGKAKAE